MLDSYEVDTIKTHQQSPPFLNAKSPGKYGKIEIYVYIYIYIFFFLESRQRKNLVVCNFYKEALSCALLRPFTLLFGLSHTFVCAVLRSFALLCFLLRVSAPDRVQNDHVWEFWISPGVSKQRRGLCDRKKKNRSTISILACRFNVSIAIENFNPSVSICGALLIHRSAPDCNKTQSTIERLKCSTPEVAIEFVQSPGPLGSIHSKCSKSRNLVRLRLAIRIASRKLQLLRVPQMGV